MIISATQLRVGQVITMDGELYRITYIHHLTPGNKRGLVQTKMKNIKTEVGKEKRFRSDEKIERAHLEQHDMEYLYDDDLGFHFMNTETYEQITLSRSKVEEMAPYLIPNATVQVDFYEGNPISIELPKTVIIRVESTEPGVKTATVTSSLKPATTETGLIVQVPQFINAGELIKVDTETGKYQERG